MELHVGDIITFKDHISIIGDSYTHNIAFKDNENGQYYCMFYDNTNNQFYYGRYSSSTLNSVVTYRYELNNWQLSKYKIITITENQTITDENFINWLYENTVSGLPPRVMENMYAVVGEQIQYSFSNIGNVVGSIVNNGVLTIFTLGIFIVSLAVGLLRRIARRKNFK